MSKRRNAVEFSRYDDFSKIKYLKTYEVAFLARVLPLTVVKWIKKGTLPAKELPMCPVNVDDANGVKTRRAARKSFLIEKTEVAKFTALSVERIDEILMQHYIDHPELRKKWA